MEEHNIKKDYKRGIKERRVKIDKMMERDRINKKMKRREGMRKGKRRRR
jgi:hypothetical protein